MIYSMTMFREAVLLVVAGVLGSRARDRLAGASSPWGLSTGRLAAFVLVAASLATSGTAVAKPPPHARGTPPPHATATNPQGLVLFPAGERGYHSFRIPALVVAGPAIVAIAEGRRNSNEDFGDIDLVYKRSTDGGRTWSPLQIIERHGDDTWGNPTVVYDAQRKRIWLLGSWNRGGTAQALHATGRPELRSIQGWGERRVKAFYSDDQGATWSAGTDLTNQVLPRNYKWDAIGPGNGIQVRSGPNAGRLIVPAIGRNIYSDDHGATWKYQLIPKGSSEGTIIERVDGRLFRNDRLAGPTCTELRRRAVTVCEADLGRCQPLQARADLPDPCSQGSMVRYSFEPSRILFLNSADTKSRRHLTIRMSLDEGTSWPVARAIPGGLVREPVVVGGYSSLAVGPDGEILALIEQNEDVDRKDSPRSLRFHSFGLDWLEGRR